MKTIAIALLVLLIPAAMVAAPTLGIYFTGVPGEMRYFPSFSGETFYGYIYGHNIDCYLTAVEYMLEVPAGIYVTDVEYPKNYQIHMGDPLTGHSVAYFPPFNGFVPGYNMLLTIEFIALEYCMQDGGTLLNAPVVIVAHPGSGIIAYTCYPDMGISEFVGLTSLLCPEEWIGVEEESWGAIKALYK